MVHGFQQIVTQAERRYNFIVHGLLPLGDEMAVSLLICRKQPMDSIGGNLGYNTVHKCSALTSTQEQVMTTTMILVQLPESLFQRLKRAAELTHRSVEELAATTLEAALPLAPDVPP